MPLQFVLFVFAIIAAFFIPGHLLVKRFRLPLFSTVVLSFIVGMVAWGWLEFIVGSLQIRWFSYVYLIGTFLGWVYLVRKEKLPRFKLSFDWKNILLGVTIVSGCAIQLSNVWFTGFYTKEGLFFCCGNISDSIYYLALTQELVSSYPPGEPGMYGVIVQNYHYWSNAVIAGLIRIFHLPLFPTQSQFMSLFLSLFLGLSALVFANTVKLSKSYAIWLVFLLYFGSDLIYVLVSFFRNELNFKMSGLETGATFLLNPPRAFSIVIFLASLSLLVAWIQKKSLFLLFLLAFVFASLAGFKVYTGMYMAFGLGFLSLYLLTKKRLDGIVLLVTTGVLASLLYFPVNKGAGGLYFTGMHILENFMVQPWMALDRLELARLIYAQHNNIPRLIEYYSIYFFIFITTMFGFKVLAIFQSRKSLAAFPKELHIFLLGGMLVSFVLGMLFQQSTGGSNTFNFLVNVFILSSLYAALALSYWLPKFPKIVQILIIVVVVVFSLPRNINEIHGNAKSIATYNGILVPNEELRVLELLKKDTTGKYVFMLEMNPEKNGVVLYRRILSGRPLYLISEGILETHGVDMKKRKAVTAQLATTTNHKQFQKLLKDNNIGYIYLLGQENLPILMQPQRPTYLKQIYQNKDLKIEEVKVFEVF